jgi:hypothetical protein
MKVYIAGPIKGHAYRNETAFRAEAHRLIIAGHEVVVPHDVRPVPHAERACPEGYDSFDGHTSACYLRADVKALLDCDAMQLLHGWQHSRGVTTVEFPVAKECGVQIYTPENPL